MGVQLTDEMIKGAQEAQKKYGIPASITLGQILLESGGSQPGGLSGLAYKAKNLFGIKGKGNAGSISMPTTEYTSSGQAYRVNANFRKYNSYQDSIQDHSELLMKERYTKYTANAKNVTEYAQGIAKGGYATSPTYASQLVSIITNNGLSKYDDGKIGGVGTGGSGDTGSGGSDKNLKWYGDIMVLAFIILIALIGIYFFIGAFAGDPLEKVSKTVKTVKDIKKGKVPKTLSEGDK